MYKKQMILAKKKKIIENKFSAVKFSKQINFTIKETYILKFVGVVGHAYWIVSTCCKINYINSSLFICKYNYVRKIYIVCFSKWWQVTNY